MNIRPFLVLLLLCACTEPEVTITPEEPLERPNIVWISAEDMGPRLGSYGDQIARTPHLDSLASLGTRYTRVFTTAGVCSPSRAAIITGMHQVSFGAHHMRTLSGAPFAPGPAPYSVVPPHYVKTFTEYLRAAGYYTTNNVKEDYQFETPVTAWDESSSEAHWRNRRDADQPFFSVFNFITTHESQIWPDPAAAFETMGLPALMAGPPPPPLSTDPAAVAVPPYYPDTPVVRRDIAQHYDNIAEMDAQAGMILEQLAEDGLTENTIVFFWSDHGDGLPRQKRWLYDSGLHVPLIIHIPGQLPGVDEELVSFLDLAPTVLSLAGVEPPAHIHGRALLGRFADNTPPHEYVYAARDRFDEQYDLVRAVRDTRYKYIRNYRPEKPYALWMAYANVMPTMQELFRLHANGELTEAQLLWMQPRRPVHEFYDTSVDPHEVNNLAYDPAYSDELSRLQTALDDWIVEVGDMGFKSELDMVESMWPGGEQPVTSAPVILPQATARTAISTSGGLDHTQSGGTFDNPVDVTMYSGTQGASITYTVLDDSGNEGDWLLFSSPLRLQESVVLRAKAIRYGYKESEVSEAEFVISPSQ
ncbi:MAG: sulfatase-like hydrolase/transferase [Bacteroidota bacterium]|nr:sulfatase-like hydrolase/transferase [Bacteroidota bacterium]MXW14789.1 sulfatase-like hydrolase/transferase [Rhodothermaceae bacterium]MXW33006.1 sulfatase-like hydrolase/transferase [Rhodothermaceae bacterium]MYC04012.1 sulfatase-like hydrolase/transferase [Rhodothermaceae bacterium]MYE64003.1 sulfatase-like hydrolase/transferase [Rhodothermaceae bacterium]